MGITRLSEFDMAKSRAQCMECTESCPPDKRCALCDLPDGQCGRVDCVGGDEGLRRRLMEMGFCNGVRVQVVRRAPLGDPMELKLRGYSLSLRHDQARHVRVTV